MMGWKSRVFDAVEVAYGLIHIVVFVIAVFFVIALAIYSVNNLVNERDALRKKVRELESKLGL